MNIFHTLGYIVNIIGFIYGVIILKSTEVLHDDISLFCDCEDTHDRKELEKWATAKLPFIVWLTLLFGLCAPYIGGVASYLVGEFYANDYLPSIHTTRKKSFYIKLERITKKVLTILFKPFKWLFIEI